LKKKKKKKKKKALPEKGTCLIEILNI